MNHDNFISPSDFYPRGSPPFHGGLMIVVSATGGHSAYLLPLSLSYSSFPFGPSPVLNLWTPFDHHPGLSQHASLDPWIMFPEFGRISRRMVCVDRDLRCGQAIATHDLCSDLINRPSSGERLFRKGRGSKGRAPRVCIL